MKAPFTLCLLLLGAGCIQCNNMEVWLSTGDSQVKLERQGDVAPSASPNSGYRIFVDRDAQRQEMKGFGAALSNTAAWLLYTQTSNRQQVLNELFHPNDGLGLSYLRIVMGGSDFNAVQPYTYNDDPPNGQDFDMQYFSIDKDQEFLIPLLKEILAINPSLRIMASPWSAPAWMKSNNNLNGGSLVSNDQHHRAWAEYFVKFVKAYEAEGIMIDTVTLQNEPEHQVNSYPTMYMSWQQQRDIINIVGPRFQEEGITTQILILDHNWNLKWYPMNILADSNARQWVAGTAWHCYGGSRWDPLDVWNAHPDKDVYFSECSGGEWDTHFGSVLGWNVQNLFIGQIRIFSRTVLLWNMALDENHGPRVGVSGGCSDCRGVVTVTKLGDIEREPEYYILGHFSKFVPPGSYRIESTTYDQGNDNLETVAFQYADGTVVVVVLNAGWDSETKTFYLELDGQYYNYENLPSRSVITFVRRAN